MQGKSTLVTIWAVLALSQVIYLIIPAFRVLPDAEGNTDFLALFAGCLGFIVFLQVVGVVVYFRRGALAPIAEGRLDARTAAGAARLFTVLVIC